MDPESPSKEELRDAYEAAMGLAMAITRSKQRAEEVVQDAFERLLTTRRWDRSKGPLDAHMLGAVRSLLSNAQRSAVPRKEATAHAAFHDQVAGRRTESYEHQTLEHAEAAERQESAATEVERLMAMAAEDPVALGVLRSRAEGLRKAGDIAAKLGVPVEQVYRANEFLKLQLKKIREAP
jgi:DNA-directed RNA polymerase specialized sigma24 family protein